MAVVQGLNDSQPAASTKPIVPPVREIKNVPGAENHGSEALDLQRQRRQVPREHRRGSRHFTVTVSFGVYRCAYFWCWNQLKGISG